FAPGADIGRFRLAANHGHDRHHGAAKSLHDRTTARVVGHVHQPSVGCRRRRNLVEPPEIADYVTAWCDLISHEVHDSAVSGLRAAQIAIAASLNPQTSD